MKNTVRALALCLTLFPALLLCDENTFTLTPARPKAGDAVTLTYNAASRTASLRDAKEITGEVMLTPYGALPTLVEIPLKADGAVWRGSFTLPETDAVIMLIRFRSGENTDDNGANVWDAMICGPDGTPVRNAHLLRSSILNGATVMDFKHARDPDAAKAEVAEEAKAYPDNAMASSVRWGMLLRDAPGDETLAQIRKELEPVCAAKSGDESALTAILYWLEKTAQKPRADGIRAAAIAARPHGRIASADAERAAYSEKDPKKAVELTEKYIRDFPPTEKERESRLDALASFCIRAGDFEKAAGTLASMSNPSGNAYNNLAWEMIDGGADVEKGVAFAKKGIAIFRTHGAAGKPAYMSANQWAQSNRTGLGLILDTYGYGLSKLRHFEEAAPAFEEASLLTEGKYPDITGRLIECESTLGRTDRVIEYARGAIGSGNATEPVVGAYKTAFARKNGSTAGFDEALAGLKADAAKKARLDLMKDRVNKPAVDFTLKSLDGKVVKLADLRGKVVVLDFWATWCGPCKYSFPYLQKVYDKYRGNDRVVILAVNTWESETGKAREALVKKFIDENRYTFPVLLDEGVVEKYGVNGIPTKFVIDRNGRIQFRKIGAEGEEMLQNLSAQIDLLLGEEFHTM